MMNLDETIMYDEQLLSSLPIHRGIFGSLTWLPGFFNEAQLQLWTDRMNHIRTLFQNFSEKEVIGQEHGFKFIAHDVGRYDIWDLRTDDLRVFENVLQFNKNLHVSTVGGLFLDKHTITNGKWHQDALELFPKGPSNEYLPTFYYTLFIALTDQTEDNGPTQFYNKLENKIFWVPLKKGDALLMPGHILHRGTANFTNENRDMIYVVYTPSWYNEEKL